jgi:hypothetical protein
MVGTDARDPWFASWNVHDNAGFTLNHAPSARWFGFNVGAAFAPGRAEEAKAFVMGTAAQCTTAFIDKDGTVNTSGLRPNALPIGPDVPAGYIPALPELRLTDDGPGENMTGRSGVDIHAALNGGATVFLGTGTYSIPGTITGGAIYGGPARRTIC